MFEKKKWKVRKKIKSKMKQNAMEVLSSPSPNSNFIQLDSHPVCAPDLNTIAPYLNISLH